jgi:hypothetical protein
MPKVPLTDEDLIEAVGEKFMEDDFQSSIDDFIRIRCRDFAHLTDAQVSLGEDNAHEFWDVYTEFQL